MFDQLLTLGRQLTISQRIGIVFGAIFSVVLIVGLVVWAGTPQMRPAFTGLSPEDAALVGEALDGAGIPWELSNGGATISVPSASISAARVAAGTGGYDGNGAPGFELFDNQGFGASEFDQQVTYQRALEGKLTDTIQKLAGVAEATVSIVTADDGVFASERRPASASVYIKMAGGGRAGGELVSAIVATVAGSVSGLTPDNVTVVGADGTVLAGPDTPANDALTIKGTVERDLSAKVQALVDRALGPGHASVAVSADLDLAQVERQIRTITPITADNWTPTSVQVTDERYGGDGTTGALGVPGTTSNVPGLPIYPAISTPAPAASPAVSPDPNATPAPSPDPNATPAPSISTSSSDYIKTVQTVNYANSEEIATIIEQPGTINRLSVAVLLDQAAMGSTTAEGLQAAITAAIGADAARGDVVSVSALEFAADPAVTETASPDIAGAATDLAPSILAGLGGVLLLFLVWRNMRALRRRADQMQLATYPANLPLLPADAAGYADGRDYPGGEYALEPGARQAALADPRARIQDQIRRVAEERPDELAGLMTQWLRADEQPRR